MKYFFLLLGDTMNNVYAKPEEVFKEKINALRNYLIGRKDKDVLVIQETEKGLVYYMGKLKSTEISQSISLALGDIADSGVYLDTDGYYTKHQMFDLPSTKWSHNNGRLFISLDALLRLDGKSNSTLVRTDVDSDTELELSKIKRPY